MGAKSRGPGPQAYTLPPTIGFQNHDLRKQRMPQYSFGCCHDTSYGTIGPGPATRYIQNITRCGKDGTPRYSLGRKISTKEKCRSPGPAQYSIKLPSCSPLYSLGGTLPRRTFVQSPGPAAYGRTDLNVKLRRSPAFSLTGRPVYWD